MRDDADEAVSAEQVLVSLRASLADLIRAIQDVTAMTAKRQAANFITAADAATFAIIYVLKTGEQPEVNL